MYGLVASVLLLASTCSGCFPLISCLRVVYWFRAVRTLCSLPNWADRSAFVLLETMLLLSVAHAMTDLGCQCSSACNQYSASYNWCCTVPSAGCGVDAKALSCLPAGWWDPRCNPMCENGCPAHSTCKKQSTYTYMGSSMACECDAGYVCTGPSNACSMDRRLALNPLATCAGKQYLNRN